MFNKAVLVEVPLVWQTLHYAPSEKVYKKLARYAFALLELITQCWGMGGVPGPIVGTGG